MIKKRDNRPTAGYLVRPNMITADQLSRGQSLANGLGIPLIEGVNIVREQDDVDAGKADHKTAAGLWRPEHTNKTLQVLAQGMPEATEKTVRQEARLVLEQTFEARELSDYPKGSTVPPGALVYIFTEAGQRLNNVTPGLADLMLMRAGWWGWVMAELKARKSTGARGRGLEHAQKVAWESGLYPVLWAPAHVGALIEQMDRQTGWSATKGIDDDEEQQPKAGKEPAKGQEQKRKGGRGSGSLDGRCREEEASSGGGDPGRVRPGPGSKPKPSPGRGRITRRRRRP